jgi:hypothetical protein
MAKKKLAAPEKRDDLIVQKLGEEMIVYDRRTHRAHSLNRSAALVFEKLDGKRDVGGVARELGTTLAPAGRTEIVATAVNELAAADLLKPGADLPRRTILRGLAAGLVPVVVSIAVPSAAAALSCVPPGGSCYYDSECCSGSCDSPFGSGFGCGYSYTCNFPA